MVLLWRGAIGTIACQMERHVDKIAAGCRVHAKTDEVLMEPVVATIHEESGQSFALRIEAFHREKLSLFDLKSLTILAFNEFSYVLVGNVVCHVANVIGCARMQRIDSLELLAFHMCGKTHI